MINNKNFEKINKNICEIMNTGLDGIALAFINDDKPLEIPELYEFCKWWVRKYPDKFINLKSSLYSFRYNRAKVFNSISSLLNLNGKMGKKLSAFTLFQLQMLTNNCIDQTNSTCQLVQTIIKMCESALKDE